MGLCHLYLAIQNYDAILAIAEIVSLMKFTKFGFNGQRKNKFDPETLSKYL